MKTFLTVASHWREPGIRQYASQDRSAAERKAAELVDELREDFHRECDRETWRGDHVPPSVANGGGDWRATLRALQLARLIDYTGGEGEANDALYGFCERLSKCEPPLIGEGFTRELQEIVGDFVEEDDCDPDKIGFPMVWIEEVDQVDDQPHQPAPPVDLIVAARDVVAAFGGNVPDWLQDEIGMLELALKPFDDVQPPMPPALVVAESN